MLEVLTRCDVTDLVEVATVRDLLGLPDASEDALLAARIAEASSALEEERGGAWGRQSYQETIDGQGLEVLLLSVWPVEPSLVTVTVDGSAVTDFEVRDPEVGILRREAGWAAGAVVVVTYTAGWLLPGQVTSWQAGATYATGAWVRPSKLSLSPRLFEAAVGGQAGGAEPAWPSAAAATVADGAVTWTAREARELPARVSRVAGVLAKQWHEEREPGLLAAGGQGFSERFDAAGEGDLPPWVVRGLASYRLGGVG